MNFVTIETNRLLLKGISSEVMNHIFNSLSKPAIKELLGHRSEEEYLQEEHKFKNGYSSYNRSFLLFLLIDKELNKIVGRCGIHNWNKDHKRAEIGYNMQDDSFKRKGLMKEAVNAIIDYGFNELKLHRLEALVGANNIASLKIMERFDFVKEGLLRQHFYIDGKYEDSIMFSVLGEEYKTKKSSSGNN